MSRQPDAARSAASRPVVVAVGLPSDHRLDERDSGDQRQVADPGDRSIVRGRIHDHDPRRAGLGERLHTLEVPRSGKGARDEHPRPVDEQVGHRSRVARRLAPGHRMAADEPNAGGVGSPEDPRLRARDIGHDGVVGERTAPRARQPIEEGQAVGRWRAEDHEVGTAEGGLWVAARRRSTTPSSAA